MAYNNADIELIAALDESSSEAEILKGIKALNRLLKSNANGKIKLDSEIDISTVDKAVKKLGTLLKSKNLSIDTKDSIVNLQKEASAMLDVVGSAKKAAKEKLDFTKANKRLSESAEESARAIEHERDAMQSLDNLDYILRNINMQGQAGNGIFQQFGNTLRDAFYAFTAANLLQDAIYKVIDGGKEAVETVKELNDAAVSLRMATGDSYDSVKNLMSSYNAMAQELGAVTGSVAEAADEWLRQGHSIEDTNTLITDSMMLSKISNLESADSTKYLTSAMQGYKVAVEDVVGIVDKLSAVDLESATDAGGLAEAMSRTAEGAQIAGVSMDRLLGMIATVGEVTQKSMSSIGESYKTVFSRMRDIKDNKLSIIGDDGEIEDLSNVEIVLDSLGIKLRDSNLEFRNFQDVLDDVAGSWNSYSSVQKAAIGKAFSGVRQQENFLVMIENWDKVLKYTDVAANSQGTSTEKFGYYLEGLEAKTNSLKASLENLASTTISDELYGSVLDTTKAIVDMTTETGILKGALVGLGTAGSIYAFQQLTGYLHNATQEFSNFSEALSMTRGGQVGINQMQNLINLTGNLTQSQTRLLLSTNNLTDTQKVAVLMNQRLAQGLPQITEAEVLQQLQTMGVATAQGAATGATISFTSALNGLWQTLLANPLVLVTAAVTAGVMAWNKYKQHLEDVRQSAQDAATAMDEQIKSVDDYVERYKELQTALQNAKGDEEATYSIKQDLLALQTELNDAFGDEYGKLNLVTDAYKDQTEAIKSYKKEIAQNFLNENDEGIKNATQKMTANNHYNLSYTGESIYNDKGKILKEIADAYSDRGISVMDEAGNGSYAQFSIHLSANAEDAYNTIADFMNDVRNKATALGNEELFADVLEISSQSLNDAKDIIDKNGEIFKEALISEIAVDDSLSAGYVEATQAVEKYNDAVLKSEDLYSDENVKNAWNNLQTIKEGISEDTEEWGKYESVMRDVFDQANDSIYSFYQTMQNDDSVSKLTKDLQGLEDTDLQSMADDGVEDSFDKLCQKANEYGLEVQDVIDLLLQMGIVQGKVVESLSDVDEPTLPSIIDSWNSLIDTDVEELKNTRKDLLALAEAGQLTAETFHDTTGADTFLDGVSESLPEVIDWINQLVASSTQLQSMSAQISKMSDMLADKKNGTVASASDLAGFDATVKGLESWEEFERVMGSSKSSMEECQAAANALATEWVNNGNFLANLTEENKQYYITQLDNMGVMNAEKIVMSALAASTEYASAAIAHNSDEKNWNNQVTTDLANATADEIIQILNEGTVSDNTREKLANLVVQKKIASGTTLSTAADIKNLADLAGASTKLGKLLNNLAKIKQGFTNGMPSDVAAAQAEQYQKQIEALVGGGNSSAVIDVPVEIKPTGSNNYSAPKTKKGSEKSKTDVDFIEKKINTINHQLDVLAEKYDGIFSPKKKKDNLDKQIEKLKRLETVATTAAKKYQKQADKITFYKDEKKDAAFKEKIRNGDFDITQFDSETASKIQAYEDYILKVRENWSTARTSKQQQTEKRIEQYQIDADVASAKIEKSKAVAENGKANYKSQNSHLEYQKKLLKEQYDAEIAIAKERKDSVEAKRLEAEYQQKLQEYEKEAFDNIQASFEYKISHIDDRIDDLNNKISDVENKGLIADASYYNSQIGIHGEILAQLEAEKKELREQLKTIDKQTPKWYECVEATQQLDNQIQETKNTIEGLKDSINGVADTLSENILDSFHDLNDEADTLITLLGDNLTDDKIGNLTKEGIAALGLYNQQMNVSKASAENIQNEIKSIQDAINNGTYTKFIDSNGMERQFDSIYEAQDRIKELQATYRSEIQSTYQYESKIVDLMKQKYQSELNYVKELIDQKTSLLDAEKSLYDYAQSIKQESENINSLRKQIAALQGDSSKETTSRIQKLQKQLKDSEQSLQDKQYDRYISDQKDMLSNLSKEYSELIESVSKDRDTLLKEGNQLISSNGAQIQQTINETADKYGMQMSTEMASATTNITTGLTGIKELLQKIVDYESDRVVDTNGDGAGGGNADNYTPAGQIKSILENGSNKNPTSELAKAVESAFGVGLNKSEMYQISSLLGLGYSKEDFYDGSTIRNEAKNAVLDGLVKEGYLKKYGNNYVRGFAKGGVISSAADAIRLNGDKVLLSGKPGERMLTAEQNENWEKWTKALPSLVNLTDVIKPNVNVPNAIDRSVGGVTYGGNNQINIEVNGVANYDEFMQRMQGDIKAERFIQTVTASALSNNASRLSKYSIKF